MKRTYIVKGIGGDKKSRVEAMLEPIMYDRGSVMTLSSAEA